MLSERPVCLADFEVHFKRSLDKNARDYFSSGANQEQTLKDNVEAFSRWSCLHISRGPTQFTNYIGS